MSEELTNKVLAEVIRKMGGDAPAPSAALAPVPMAGAPPAVTESVGIGVLGDTIDMVIANADLKLRAMTRPEKDFRSIGILDARTDASPHIFAVDEVVKTTNSEILTTELPRGTKGGAGYGSLVIFGTEDVSDTRRAVEVALGELDRAFGDVYDNDAGRLKFQYTVRVSYALNEAFGAPINKAFDITVDTPADIGVVLADVAVKVITIDVINYVSPAGGTSYSDEVVSLLNGNSGIVRQAITAAHEVGASLLGAPGARPEFTATPYI